MQAAIASLLESGRIFSSKAGGITLAFPASSLLLRALIAEQAAATDDTTLPDAPGPATDSAGMPHSLAATRLRGTMSQSFRWALHVRDVALRP